MNRLSAEKVVTEDEYFVDEQAHTALLTLYSENFSCTGGVSREKSCIQRLCFQRYGAR
jgi:hypothetical protein